MRGGLGLYEAGGELKDIVIPLCQTLVAIRSEGRAVICYPARLRVAEDVICDVHVAWETYHTARTEWLETSARISEPGIVWTEHIESVQLAQNQTCLLYTSPSPRD